MDSLSSIQATSSVRSARAGFVKRWHAKRGKCRQHLVEQAAKGAKFWKLGQLAAVLEVLAHAAEPLNSLPILKAALLVDATAGVPAPVVFLDVREILDAALVAANINCSTGNGRVYNTRILASFK